MKIFVDENIPLMTVNELKRLGYDIRDIRGSEEGGLPDAELWKTAQEENRLLITTCFCRTKSYKRLAFLLTKSYLPLFLKKNPKVKKVKCGI